MKQIKFISKKTETILVKTIHVIHPSSTQGEVIGKYDIVNILDKKTGAVINTHRVNYWYNWNYPNKLTRVTIYNA